LRVGLAAVAPPLLSAEPLALSIAASLEVRFATCFSSATSRCSGAVAPAATADAEGSGGADLTGTGLVAAAGLARRVGATLAATALLAGSARALRAGTDVVALFTVALVTGAVLAAACVVGAVFAVVFFAEVAVALAGRLVALGLAGVSLLEATPADVRVAVAVARTALPVLDVAGADAWLAAAFTDGVVLGLACAAA
jgi:hypothetical protein